MPMYDPETKTSVHTVLPNNNLLLKNGKLFTRNGESVEAYIQEKLRTEPDVVYEAVLMKRETAQKLLDELNFYRLCHGIA